MVALFLLHQINMKTLIRIFLSIITLLVIVLLAEKDYRTNMSHTLLFFSPAQWFGIIIGIHLSIILLLLIVIALKDNLLNHSIPLLLCSILISKYEIIMPIYNFFYLLSCIGSYYNMKVSEYEKRNGNEDII